MAESKSSIALDALLKAGGPEAEAISDEATSKIHRTQVWKYRTGRRKPDAETIARLERLSEGRVPANGWEDLSVEQAAEFVAQLARDAAEKARASQRPREDAATDPQEPIEPSDSDPEPNTAVDIEAPPKSGRFVDESESQAPPRRRNDTPAGAR
jgi:hypothetical protein